MLLESCYPVLVERKLSHQPGSDWELDRALLMHPTAHASCSSLSLHHSSHAHEVGLPPGKLVSLSCHILAE